MSYGYANPRCGTFQIIILVESVNLSVVNVGSRTCHIWITIPSSYTIAISSCFRVTRDIGLITEKRTFAIDHNSFHVLYGFTSVAQTSLTIKSTFIYL